jgi:hypothetical protein
VRKYHLHLASRKLEAQTINQIMCALRFLYGTTLGKANVAEHIPLARRSDPLPAILSRDEVASFLNAVPSLKYRTAFATIYAAGLRVSEAVALTIRDIDSTRKVIHIRHGKGRKDRYVMLSDQLLDLLRTYWANAKPRHWLFPGASREHPVTTRQLQRVFRAARPSFFLSVRVLSRLFRRLFLQYLDSAFATGELQFFSDLTALKGPSAFKQYLSPLRRSEWVVFAKLPFAGPGQVLAYLARYTHRVAIANSRLLSLSGGRVSLRWKDYRQDGKGKVMTFQAGEFIRRFLMHTLPDGFHRIRHYGLFANGHRANKIELCRKLLAAPSTPTNRNSDDCEKVAPTNDPPPCPCCGGRMRIIETLEAAYVSRTRSHDARRFDSS